MKISLVIPVYNEQYYFNEVMEKYLGDLNEGGRDYEVVIINDGCDDQTPIYMAELAEKNKKVKIITFDKRYGKQAGITAGMAYATGDIVVLADIDKMNPIGVLNKAILEYEQGNKIVYGYKENKKGKTILNTAFEKSVGFFAKFYKLKGEYVPQPNIAVYDRAVVDVINEMPEKNKILRIMDNWVEWDIKRFSYPTLASKAEVKKDKAYRAKKAKEEGKYTKRSKVREHTKHLIASTALLIAAGIFVLFGILLGVGGSGGHFMTPIIFILVGVGLGFISFMFFGKTLLIRKIGVINNNVAKICNISNTINIEK